MKNDPDENMMHFEVNDFYADSQHPRPLCLNGSYHARRTRSFKLVNCPRCREIKAMCDAGFTRKQARQTVINKVIV